MGQFVQAGLLAFSDVVPVVHADLDPALNSVGVTDPFSAHHGYRAGVGRERSLEPAHLLNGMNITRTLLISYQLVIFGKHGLGQAAYWQAGGQLRVVRCFL